MGAARDIAQSVRDAFARWGEAWNSGDLDGYLTAYRDAEETRYIRSGEVVQGRAAIVSRYRHAFRDRSRMGMLTVQHLDVDVIGEADALVFGIWRHSSDGVVSEGVFTVHVRCFDGKWLIMTDHTSG